MILKIDLDEEKFVKVHRMAQENDVDPAVIVGGMVGIYLDKNANQGLVKSKYERFVEDVNKALAVLKNDGKEVEKHHKQKLSSDKIQKIYELYDSGAVGGYRKVAESLGVSKHCVQKYLKKRKNER